jgi:hypothetical protein
MSLDSYIIKLADSGRAYRVLRYKTMELMDERTIYNSRIGLSPTDKRERIVRQFIDDGKPSTAVYWLENNKVKSLKLKEETNAHTISGIDRIENGKLHIWVGGKKIPVQTPRGMTTPEFEIKIKELWAHDIGDAQDWLMGSGGFADTLSAFGIELVNPGEGFVSGDDSDGDGGAGDGS